MMDVPIGSARSRTVGISSAGTGRAANARRRIGRWGRSRPWDARRGVYTPGRWSRGSAGPESIIYSRGASPVVVAVRRIGVADGGAGVPIKADKDTVESVVAAEFVSCVDLLDKGVGCTTVIAAARFSAKPVPPSMGMAKTKAKTVSAAGSTRGRYSFQQCRWKQKPERRVSPDGQKNRRSFCAARVCENREMR